MHVMRLWHTLRRLRPVQVWGRFWFRVYRPRPDLRSAPALRATPSNWRPCARAAVMSGPSTFRFLGVEHALNTGNDWNRNDWPKLWLYNLHYFDDLAAEAAVHRTDWHRSLIARWIAENPPGKGNGWEPYPVSLRLVNWVKWVLMGNTLDEEANASLAVQVRWLRRRLEIHLLGNHLWANAKALVFAGVYFRGTEADRWRTKGLALLRRELKEQILADGGHFERSPMYHAIVLEDLLDLVQLTVLFPGVIPSRDVQNWRAAVSRMLHWLRVMTHPDGGIAFFNDAVLGIAACYSDLLAYARPLGVAVPEEPLAAIEPLPESGYVRMEAGPAVLIADVGEIGPEYLPGHAHADTLSFEFSLHGKRVLVNAGISTYDVGVERLHQRGTAAHNAVEINGENSSEVWGSFRVARRARPLNVAWAEEDGQFRLRASHDGYIRLGTVGRVDRTWRLSPQQLRIEDEVEGKPESAIARFRGHPSLAFDLLDDRSGAIHGRDVSLHWKASDAKDAHIISDIWHPRFGASEACQVLELDLCDEHLSTEFLWT